MYEVEVKSEINESQLQKLLATLALHGFADNGVAPQKDYYTKAVESHNNAFDIERYRAEAGRFFYTKKEWEVEDGKFVRREDEHEVTEVEFEQAVTEYPNALKIFKDRHWFAGSYEGREIKFSIDSVKFGHSPAVRYFVEPEICIEDRSLVQETRNFLRTFVARLLDIEVEEFIEAPGMFALAFKKL
jgi:adenylate cyclase class IV